MSETPVENPHESIPPHDWGDEVALQQLQEDVKSPEDQTYLDQVDKELLTSLRNDLGKTSVRLVEDHNGLVTTAERVEEQRAAGQETGSHDFGGRVS